MKTNVPLLHFSDLIGSIYEGALDTPPWQAQLAHLRDALGATDAFLILRRPSDAGLGIIFSAESSLAGQPHAPYYAQRLYALDPFVNLPPNQPVLLSEFIGEAASPDNAFFRLVLAPSNIAHILGVDLRDPTGPGANLRFTRSQAQQPFGEAEKQLCALLVPHFCRALRAHSRISEIETERQIYAGAMSQLAVATLLLDEHQHVVRTNRLADRLLENNRGLHLSGGFLKLLDTQQDAKLRQLIAEVAEAQRSGTATIARAMLIETGIPGAQLSLVIRLVPPGQSAEGANVPVIALFVSDPSQHAASSAGLLGELFRLTPAEAKLSVLLANGASVETASAELHISPYTARAHLRSIFSKLGVTRQPELVRLVLKSAASLG